MPSSLKLNKKLRIVEVTHKGVMTVEGLRRIVSERVVIEKETGIGEVLVDASELESVEDLASLLDLPQMYVDAEISRTGRTAVIMPTSKEGIDAARFYENVCFNRGWTVQLFETKREALEWLIDSEAG